MQVYFCDEYENMNQIGESLTLKEAADIISKFLRAHHYQSRYWNIYADGGDVHIDVGSHTQFFVIETGLNEVNISQLFS